MRAYAAITARRGSGSRRRSSIASSSASPSSFNCSGVRASGTSATALHEHRDDDCCCDHAHDAGGERPHDTRVPPGLVLRDRHSWLSLPRDSNLRALLVRRPPLVLEESAPADHGEPEDEEKREQRRVRGAPFPPRPSRHADPYVEEDQRERRPEHEHEREQAVDEDRGRSPLVAGIPAERSVRARRERHQHERR